MTTSNLLHSSLGATGRGGGDTGQGQAKGVGVTAPQELEFLGHKVFFSDSGGGDGKEVCTIS